MPVSTLGTYAVLIRRPVVQPGTIGDELAVLAQVFDWASRRGVNLEDRLAAGEGLSPDELRALYHFLGYHQAFARMTASEALHKIPDSALVSGSVHRRRVLITRDFLVWGLERTAYQLRLSDPRLSHVQDRIKRVILQAREFKKHRRSTDRHGLTPELRRRLLEIADPAYVNNPFQRRVRYRNWIVILLLLMFGYRRGEILKLRVDKIKLGGSEPTITILRSPDDPEDLRPVHPSVKTLGRELPLSISMSRALRCFIQEHRPQFPGSEFSPFLIFSVDGAPLSLRSVNNLCTQITRRFPELEGLTPHVLRHTFNDELNSTAVGLSEQDRIQAINYLNGWVLDSKQSYAYTRNSTQDRAFAISRLHQEGLFQ